MSIMAVMAPKPKKPRTSELYRWRMAKKWTQAETAKEFGLSLRAYQNWEAKPTLPKRNQIVFNVVKAKHP